MAISQIKNNEKFMSYEKLKNNKVRIDFVTYRGITQAMQKYRQKLILKPREKIVLKMQPRLRIIISSRKGASNIYKTLISAIKN